MELIIDIGNTLTKIAFFDNNTLSYIEQTKELKKEHLFKLLYKFPQTDSAIISAVKSYSTEVKESLENKFEKFIETGIDTALPITNKYQSPKTLGYDRLAAAIGAETLFPGKNLLIIDAGTAITYDILTSQKEYLGGSISPGLFMRYKALHYFTEKLPLVNHVEQINITGNNTESSILSGVQFGIFFEIKETIRHYKKRFKNLKVVITGGDSVFLYNKIKGSIVLSSNLNLLGLNRILEYNKLRHL